jgi:glutamine synthetase
LPRSLGEAIAAFDADPLSEVVMGRVMKKSWSDFKRDEWLSYTAHVSDWETARYLRFF